MKNKPSEKDLERIFHEELNNPRINYDNRAWEKMEVLLDNRKSRKNRIIFWWWFLEFLAIATISGIWLWNYNGDDKIEIQITEMTGADEKKLPLPNDESDKMLNKSSIGEPIVESMDHNPEMDPIKNDASISNQLPVNNALNIRKNVSSSQDTKSLPDQNAKNILVDADPNISDTPIEKVPIQEKFQEFLERANERGETTIDRNVKIIPLRERTINPLIFERNFDLPNVGLVEIDSNYFRKLKFGMSIGPEWSATPSSGYGNKDISMDASVLYLLSSKIGIFSGVGYISDTYEAGKTDYKPERGFWTRSIAPEKTTAMCKIFDFPVGINYFFSGSGRSGFQLSTAVVSQFMAREIYYYKYEYPEPDLVKNWMGNGESFHLFSTLNFTAGYRKDIGKGIFLGFSPFINIPMKGIGHGHIKLSSSGFKLSIDF